MSKMSTTRHKFYSANPASRGVEEENNYKPKDKT